MSTSYLFSLYWPLGLYENQNVNSEFLPVSISAVLHNIIFSSLCRSRSTDIKVFFFTFISNWNTTQEQWKSFSGYLWLKTCTPVPLILNILTVAFKSKLSQSFIWLLFRNVLFPQSQPLKINLVLQFFLIFCYIIAFRGSTWRFGAFHPIGHLGCQVYFRELMQNCCFTRGIPDVMISKPQAEFINSASQLLWVFVFHMNGKIYLYHEKMILIWIYWFCLSKCMCNFRIYFKSFVHKIKIGFKFIRFFSIFPLPLSFQMLQLWTWVIFPSNHHYFITLVCVKALTWLIMLYSTMTLMLTLLSLSK